jgi:hypothetical protein
MGEGEIAESKCTEIVVVDEYNIATRARLKACKTSTVGHFEKKLESNERRCLKTSGVLRIDEKVFRNETQAPKFIPKPCLCYRNTKSVFLRVPPFITVSVFS